jgi:hypothetical protein
LHEGRAVNAYDYKHVVVGNAHGHTREERTIYAGFAYRKRFFDCLSGRSKSQPVVERLMSSGIGMNQVAVRMLLIQLLTSIEHI